jgi:teichuronic acid biosynthesis glycosyltransferase TuaH
MTVISDNQTQSGAPARHDGLIVLCANNNYNAVKVADHHLAERLAHLAPLLYVDPPMSRFAPRHDPRVAPSLEGPRLRREEAGFWRLTPVVAPFPMRPGMHAITQFLVRRMLARAVGSIGLEVRSMISSWPTLDVFGACGEKQRVWWAQDDFSALARLQGDRADKAAASERARAASGDAVIAANPVVAERWEREGHNVTLIPFGSDPATFAGVEIAPLAPEINLPDPIAVLVGQFNDRVEPSLLEAVADRGISLLLVGPDAADATWLHALAARPNVQWVGPKQFADLPGYLTSARVGLVPYTDSPFNRASFPLKTLEYLSAGLPVISTDLPATRWLKADADLVVIADGPAAFADAVESALAMPMTSNARARRRRFAQAHSYEQRALDFMATLDRLDR